VATEGLHADNGANQVTVDIDVASIGLGGNLSDGFVDTGMDAKGLAGPHRVVQSLCYTNLH
jgi:hypothetical protein